MVNNQTEELPEFNLDWFNLDLLMDWSSYFPEDNISKQNKSIDQYADTANQSFDITNQSVDNAEKLFGSEFVQSMKDKSLLELLKELDLQDKLLGINNSIENSLENQNNDYNSQNKCFDEYLSSKLFKDAIQTQEELLSEGDNNKKSKSLTSAITLTKFSEINGNESLSELLNYIEHNNNPYTFKEAVLEGIQLYFDGLVENDNDELYDLSNSNNSNNSNKSYNLNHWDKQLEILNSFLTGIKKTVSSYFKYQEIPFNEVRELILPYDYLLVKYGSKKKSKQRHLFGFATEKDLIRYYQEVADILKNEKLSIIMPIASGGFEPAVLAADCLGIDHIVPFRYSRFSRRDPDILIPVQAPLNYFQQQIFGRNILLIDDVVASGETAGDCARWVDHYNPTKLYFAAVLNKGKNKIDECLYKYQNTEYIYKYKNQEKLF